MGYGQYSTGARLNGPIFTRGDGKELVPGGKRGGKTVFDTDEIPHLWAHQAQSSARNKQGNLFFRDSTIYSYRESFPIGRHVTNDKGEHAVLITTNTYSVTTASHIHAVKLAVPHEVPTFHVHLVTDSPLRHSSLYGHYIKLAEDNLAKAKSRPSKAKHWPIVRAAIQDANRFNEFFGYVKRYELPENHIELERITVEWQSTGETRRLARHERQSAERRKKHEEYEATQAMVLPEKIAAWRNGRYVHFGYHYMDTGSPIYVPTMLRITGDTVETSQGARFPLEHAVKALPLVLALRGREYKRNGSTIHLGHYVIDSIDGDGTVHAGCHHISPAEVDHFVTLIHPALAQLPLVTGALEMIAAEVLAQ